MTTLELDAKPQLDAKGKVHHRSRRLELPLAPSLEHRRLQCYVLLAICDLTAIAVAFSGASHTLHGVVGLATLRQLALVMPTFLVTALWLNAYSKQALISVRFSRNRALWSLACSFCIALFIAFFAKASDQFSRSDTLTNFAIGGLLLLLTRTAVQVLIRQRCGQTAENVLIFDDCGDTVRLPYAWHIDTTEHRLAPDRNDPHMLDRLAMFMTNMDRVLVSCPKERQMDWAMVFKGSNVSGEIVDPTVIAMGVLGARRSYGLGTLVVSTGPLAMRNRVTKRLMDVAIAGSALIFLLPLLLSVSFAIFLEDRGPIFFKQQRQGRNNRLFWIFKFRSMSVGQLDHKASKLTTKNDARVTRVGRFIRKTSIDELPQLINVLIGEMSIVGPRPHALGALAGSKPYWEVDPRYHLRHALKPGLTGLAQIRGFRGATDTEADLSGRLQADLEYLDGWTIWRDIQIMFATFTVLIHDRAF